MIDKDLHVRIIFEANAVAAAVGRLIWSELTRARGIRRLFCDSI